MSTRTASRDEADHAVLSPRAFARLRSIRRAGPASERCELCASPIPPDHPHLLGQPGGQIHCACEACAILFDGETSARFRRIPREVRSIPDIEITAGLWDTFGVPVRLAFFGVDPAGAAYALYPSPAGAVRSSPNLSVEVIHARHPVLRLVRPAVEALLVNTLTAPGSCLIAPIDRCFQLVGLVRSHWRDVSGGPEVRERIDVFFQQLCACARNIDAGVSCGHARREVRP